MEHTECAAVRSLCPEGLVVRVEIRGVAQLCVAECRYQYWAFSLGYNILRAPWVHLSLNTKPVDTRVVCRQFTIFDLMCSKS